MAKKEKSRFTLSWASDFPVAFYDSKNKVIALAHLGWKPIDKQLVMKVINELKNKYDTQARDIRVFIGPGIHKESYILKDPAQNKSKEWLGFLTDLPSGETQVDLIGYIQKQLADAGVLPENIEVSPIGTVVSKEYFSHYRSVRTGEPEGRFATILSMKEI
jgi:hypothetical protein